MKKQNVAYLRVSTEAQTEKYGLDMQKQKILDYCEKNGVTIDKWYIDGGYSGSKLDRPEMQALLDDAERGQIGTVYIYKLDRMSRDVIDTLNLLHRVLPKYGVKVVSMVEELRIENPMDKVMLTMNAAMGQYEREIIYMRTRAGMKERVKKGLWPGGGRVPWGYYYDRNDGILHPHPEQAEMVRKAYEMYIDEYACDKIAKILGFNSERIVMQVLQRKSNIGLIEYNREVYQGKHEPIVSEEIFYKAQECMLRRRSNSYVSDKNILTGLCYCGRCGAKMRYQKWGAYHKIICYSQGSYGNGKECLIKDPDCDNKKINATIVESYVERCFKQIAVNVNERKKNQESKRAFLEDSVKKCNTKIKKLYAVYAENDSDNLLEVIKEQEERLKELKAELQSEIKKESEDNSIDLEEIKRGAHVWDTLTKSEKNKVLKQCIDRVVIDGEDVEVFFRL
ncbi:MAG: recombinase family protein [Lachnospiraceae bacterium]|nr:recombinase family protein [Lachnospiraceae bacterium]